MMSRGYDRYPVRSIDAGSRGSLRSVVFHATAFPQEPRWVGFASLLANQDLYLHEISYAHSAVIILEYDGHCYAMTFGSGHNLAKKLPVEGRFGKIAVSNGKQENQVRGLKSSTTGPNGKQRLERRGRGGNTLELEMPRRAHKASGLAAKVTLIDEFVADGDIGVKLKCPPDYPTLIKILETIEVWWNGGIEKDPILAGLDRIIEIRDKNKIELLNNQLQSDIVKDKSDKFSLCLDHDELWEANDVEYYFQGKWWDAPIEDEHLLFGCIRQVVRQDGVEAQKVRYRATMPLRATPYAGPLLHNLSYETEMPGDKKSTAVFESGRWYQAKSSWISQVDQDVLMLKGLSVDHLKGISFPDRLGPKEQEEEYMDRFVQSLPSARCLKLHPRTCPPLKLELCDVCVDQNVLFFIKRGHDRKACGDVVEQALQTATALADSTSPMHAWAESEFEKVNWKFDVRNRPSIVFCVLLLTGKPMKCPTTYSIRAKDALSRHLRDIEQLNFSAVLAVV